MDQQLQEIGARLKQARLAKKLTQNQLAEAAGISVSFLSYLENGHQAMNIQTLISLLDVLNVSADWLLGNGTDSANHGEAILRLVLVMKDSIGKLKPEPNE